VETYVSRDVFDRLAHLAEISRIPDCRVDFELFDGPIKYLLASEEMKWDNAGDAANRRAIFESCQFFTQLRRSTNGARFKPYMPARARYRTSTKHSQQDNDSNDEPEHYRDRPS
jgi:hypothetical protein